MMKPAQNLKSLFATPALCSPEQEMKDSLQSGMPSWNLHEGEGHC